MSHRSARRSWPGAAIAALVVLGFVLGGCTATTTASRHALALGPKPVVRAEVATAAVRDVDNVTFGHAAGVPLFLDLCLPAQAPTPSIARRPVVVLVHGGSWAHGDKSEWSGICHWLASEGFVAASIGYRLAPEYVFPAGIDDVETAVRWLRSPAQVAEYSINPDRVGAFGGSAGGNLVSLLGVSATGAAGQGDHVEAVVELSAPIDLTSAGLEQPDFYPLELSYLGCTSYDQCPQAVAASPIFHVAATDPPFFIAQSTDELIPLVQSQRFAAALRAKHVPTIFTTRPGDRHSVAMLDPVLRLDILHFLQTTLGDPSLVTP
jgi:acetyl esterase